MEEQKKNNNDRICEYFSKMYKQNGEYFKEINNILYFSTEKYNKQDYKKSIDDKGKKKFIKSKPKRL